MVDDETSKAKLLKEVGRMCRQVAKAERAVDQHKHSEQVLRERENAYRWLLDDRTDGVFLASRGRIIFANKTFAGYIGAEQDQLDERSLGDYISSEDVAKLENALKTMPNSNTPFETFTINWQQADGSLAKLLVKGLSIFPGVDGPVIACTVSKIRRKSRRRAPTPLESGERQSLEDQMRQSQKMEAIGTLAGGVAHDMNNILGAIMSLTSIMRQETRQGDPRIEDLDDILAAARRGRDLTKNLLGFARKGKYRKETVSLNRIVMQVKELLSRTIPKNIEWKLDLDDTVSPVQGDFGQLSHALLNICINSADAMKNGGILRITTAKVKTVSLDDTLFPGLEPGEYAMLQVTDNGVGMEAKVLERAFEPFFSTKGRDKGTGLGLSMVYGTITNHGGRVTIHSEPGIGTRLTIYLPTAKDKPLDKRSEPNAKPVQKVASGSILVVDDEELVRRSAKRVLETLGYEVVLASNGQDAIHLLKKRIERLLLVILDLEMPIMDGEETFFQLKELDSKIPVLISTGYTREGKAEDLLAAGAHGFIQKPFDAQSLASAVVDATQGGQRAK